MNLSSSPPQALLQDSAIVQQHFTLNPLQHEKLRSLGSLYTTWNEQINLISRKDIKHLYLRHILHSLSISKIIQFQPQTAVLDLGTGGGIPGIPLAILFPKTHFMLIDATAKKIKAVKNIAQTLGLHNVTTNHIRAEQLQSTYDFIVCRAVSSLSKLYEWTKNNFKTHSQHKLPNGLLCLKGGDLTHEISSIKNPYHIYNLSSFFKEPFFTTKKLVHIYSDKKS